MPSSENSLVALKAFTKCGYAFKAGDEVNTVKAAIHRIYVSRLIRERKIGFGPIVRTWEQYSADAVAKESALCEALFILTDKEETEAEALNDETPLPARIKRTSGNKYNVLVGNTKQNDTPLTKDEAQKVMEELNG